VKSTCNWLKQYVDFDWSAQELAERLMLTGMRDAGMLESS